MRASLFADTPHYLALSALINLKFRLTGELVLDLEMHSLFLVLEHRLCGHIYQC